MCSRSRLHKDEIRRLFKEGEDEQLAKLSSGESDDFDDNLESLDRLLEAKEAYLALRPDECPFFIEIGETYTCICPPGGRLCECRYLSEEAKQLLRDV